MILGRRRDDIALEGLSEWMAWRGGWWIRRSRMKGGLSKGAR